MSEWSQIILGDLLTQKRRQITIDPDREYSLVTITNKGEVKFREAKKGSIIGAQKGYITKAGDFIYSRLALHTGAFGIVPGELSAALVTNEMPCFEIDTNKILPSILLDSIRLPSFLWQLKQLTRGMGRVRIKESVFLSLLIALPDMAAQKRIAKKLVGIKESHRALRFELARQKTLLKKLRQQILQEAIEGKLTSDWRAENADVEPASELLKRITAEKTAWQKAKLIRAQKPLRPIRDEEKLFDLPGGWEWCRLQEITSLITDGKHGDCQNMHNSGCYFLSAKDVQKGRLLYKNARQIVPGEFLEVHKRTNLEAGDICMVNTGATIGKLAIAPDLPLTKKTTFQKSVAVIKVVRPFIQEKFVALFLTCETSKLLATSWGSAINNLLLGDLKEKVLALPSLAEQQAIVSKVETFLALCDQLEAQISQNEIRVEQLMQSVLKEVFRNNCGAASSSTAAMAGEHLPAVVHDA